MLEVWTLGHLGFGRMGLGASGQWGYGQEWPVFAFRIQGSFHKLEAPSRDRKIAWGPSKGQP